MIKVKIYAPLWPNYILLPQVHVNSSNSSKNVYINNLTQLHATNLKIVSFEISLCLYFMEIVETSQKIFSNLNSNKWGCINYSHLNIYSPIIMNFLVLNNISLMNLYT